MPRRVRAWPGSELRGGPEEGGARALGPGRADERGPRSAALKPGGAAGRCARGWGAAAGAWSEEWGGNGGNPKDDIYIYIYIWVLGPHMSAGLQIFGFGY